MSLDKIIWYVNGVEMPTPSGVKYDFEDLDNQSYRSVIDGSLIRDRIASEFPLKNSSELNFFGTTASP